ncbi:enterobactin exporter EntS [Klebsiella pneumoniae]|uniref:Enterobactin exporter EntS n=1 Tax=Klebsiella pneumoniae TaxID=573 RepID=A0A3S4KMB7_KLEPN|nr:enterobactin exporter EntS [Klebsiella pneumoniae]
MNRQSWLLNLSLLKNSPGVSRRFYRSLYLYSIAWPAGRGHSGADPDDDHSTWQVGLSVTLTGASMFVGLMVGGACWLTAMNVNA